MTVGEGIIASLWPVGSQIDDFFQYNNTELDGTRQLRESSNGTLSGNVTEPIGPG